LLCPGAPFLRGCPFEDCSSNGILPAGVAVCAPFHHAKKLCKRKHSAKSMSHLRTGPAGDDSRAFLRPFSRPFSRPYKARAQHETHKQQEEQQYDFLFFHVLWQGAFTWPRSRVPERVGERSVFQANPELHGRNANSYAQFHCFSSRSCARCALVVSLASQKPTLLACTSC